MTRAVSIHVGVNEPQERGVGRARLHHSETSAWRMAELASQAGYDSLLVLRGREATRQAVHEALAAATRTLARGDTLLVSFSGHGALLRDLEGDDRGFDEGWCLYDGVLLDDQLAGYWTVFQAGVRIVVVAESCFSAGTLRHGRDDAPAPPHGRERQRVLRSAGWGDRPVPDGAPERDGTVRPAPLWAPGRVMRSGGSSRAQAEEPAPGARWARSCIGEPPREAYGVRASILLLAASTEEQESQDGLYTKKLLEVWDGGAFRGSYCDLHARVRESVMRERSCQEPQILMMGAPDPGFPLETAFHVDRRTLRRPPTYR